MNSKHMDFQKKTMLALGCSVDSNLVYAVALCSACQKEKRRMSRRIGSTGASDPGTEGSSENERWIEQEDGWTLSCMGELPEIQ